MQATIEQDGNVVRIHIVLELRLPNPSVTVDGVIAPADPATTNPSTGAPIALPAVPVVGDVSLPPDCEATKKPIKRVPPRASTEEVERGRLALLRLAEGGTTITAVAMALGVTRKAASMRVYRTKAYLSAGDSGPFVERVYRLNDNGRRELERLKALYPSRDDTGAHKSVPACDTIEETSNTQPPAPIASHGSDGDHGGGAKKGSNLPLTEERRKYLLLRALAERPRVVRNMVGALRLHSKSELTRFAGLLAVDGLLTLTGEGGRATMTIADKGRRRFEELRAKLNPPSLLSPVIVKKHKAPIERQAEALETYILKRCSGAPRTRGAVVEMSASEFEMDRNKVATFVSQMVAEHTLDEYNHAKIITTAAGEQKLKAMSHPLS